MNPRRQALDGLPVYPDVARLPRTPDLAVIAARPDTVPGLVAALAARGTKAAVIITAGFGEMGMLAARCSRRRWTQPALVGEVLHDNGPMLEMCRGLGFTVNTDPENAAVLRVRKPLTPE